MPKCRFNSISNIPSLIIVLLFLAPGCTHHPLAPGHHIAIDPDGRPIGHAGDHLEPLDVKQFRGGYVQPILDGIEKHLRKNQDQPDGQHVLLFIHGGLNGYDDGREHVLKLLAAQKEPQKYPLLSSHYVVAINWEAGLKSALWDHFFEVRGGFRNRPLAIATSPFIFTKSVGQAILNVPRDAYYAYGQDLALDQFPNLASTGLVSSLIAASYGGIVAGTTNLTFVGIMPQALAIAAGIYIGPQVISDPTYYGFGPVRMLSAPIIDAFGGPAWEMLKRRPDLTLLNPEIYPKEDVEGPAYLLLKAISEKIKIDKEERTWKTGGGESLPVKLTLVGHSMGAMVADRILQTFGERLRFDNILYMGAASTIADFQQSVIPHLKRYPQTTFWAYSLTEEDEAAEKLPGDLLMRGSLLEWIDKLFEPPQNLLHYRFGKEKSQEHVFIRDKEIWSHICRITSSGDSERDFMGNPKEDSKPGVPRKHGDFTDSEMLEKALSFAHRGCPTIVDLNTASRAELSHIPYIEGKAIDAIVRRREQKRFDDKEELVDAQIIPYKNYACAAEYIAPIDINRATNRQIARLLRGDRFLAKKIVESLTPTGHRDKPNLDSLSVLLNKYLPERFYREVMGKVTLTSDKKTWDCLPSFGAEYQRLIRRSVWPDGYVSRRFQIRNQYDDFQFEIISKLKTMKDITLISKRDRIREDPKSMEDFWAAVVEVAGKRIGLDIHVRAELGEKGDLANWHKDPDVTRQHHISIKERAKADQLAAVFSIWDKNISKWPGFEGHETELKQALGTTRFVSLSGTPESIAEAILKETQILP